MHTCTNEEDALIRHINLVRGYARVGHRRMMKPSTIYDYDDMVQEGLIELIKAIRTDKGKSKFTTYLRILLKNRYYTLMTKSFRIPNNDGMEPNDVFKHQVGRQAMIDHTNAMGNFRGDPGTRTTKNVDSEDFMSSLIKLLTDTEIEYITMVFRDKQKADIRKTLGICRNTERKIRKSIGDKMIRLGVG